MLVHEFLAQICDEQGPLQTKAIDVMERMGKDEFEKLIESMKECRVPGSSVKKYREKIRKEMPYGSLREIAKTTGFSVVTISKYFNVPSSIKGVRAQKITYAIAQWMQDSNKREQHLYDLVNELIEQKNKWR